MQEKGSKGYCDNYGPIAQLSTFSEDFERLFMPRLIKFQMFLLGKNNSITYNQLGFLKKKSTVDAVHALVLFISKALDLSVLDMFLT